MENDSLTPQLLVESKAWYQRRGVLAVIILVFLAIIASSAYLVFVQPRDAGPASTFVEESQIPSSSAIVSATEVAVQPRQLPDRLKELPNLHIVKDRGADRDAQVNYYEVKDINISGAKLILAQDEYCDGVGCVPTYYRFLQNGNNYTLLTKYSFPLEGNYGITRDDLNISSTSDMDIPVLDVPSQLQDQKTGAIVELYKDSFTTGDLFSPDDATLIFTAGSYDVFLPNNSGEEIYFTQSPDGKKLIYSLSDSFLQMKNGYITSLNIQWNSGIKHSNNFRIDPLDSCQEGEAYYKAVIGTTISEADLIAVGIDKNSGRSVYAIKDASNPILQAVKDQVKVLNGEDVLYGAGKSQTQYSPYDVIYWKDPFSRLIRFVSFGMEACGGKPVIYLYPTKTTKVNVQVNPVGGISKSEPFYNAGWEVVAQPDGTLILDNQTYPYLFWEGGLGSYTMPEEGFVVPKNEVKKLLTEKLAIIGLNNREINDFEQFWLPKMQSAPYYFVTFTVNADMEKYAPLTITPKPDTLIRVFMDYKPLQSYYSCPSLQLKSTERKDFTVVEWGGSLK